MNKEKEECFRRVCEIEEDLRALLEKVSAWRDAYEFPELIEISMRKKKDGKVSTITASWLQREYGIGYNRASKLLEAIKQYERTK